MKVKYELFGMKPTSENITKAGEYRYYRATAGYLLVYTRDGQPEKSIPIEVSQLSQDDLLWLQNCNLSILQDTVERSADMQESMLEFLKRLETELAAEKKKLSQQEGGK